LLEVLIKDYTTMKIIRFFPIIIIAFLITGCFYPQVNAAPSNFSESELKPTQQETQENPLVGENNTTIQEPSREIIKVLPEIISSQIPAPDLYGCQARIEFSSGPLENKTTEFDVLDESYFLDKGDQFAVGKGTAIYYESQPYLILHSSYVNGNVLRPMEAEFIRKYLENWGRNGDEFIQDQIDSLIGSRVNWYCDEELVLETTISSIARLSHEASERLWLQPTEIEDILADKEGLSSEWIGEITPTDEPNIYLGFCGWGPSNLEYGRYTYFRYLLNFTIQNP
jgi:hypothetical protein